MSDNPNTTILADKDSSSTSIEQHTINISISQRTYQRLLDAGKFSDRTFDGIISRILDERIGKETNPQERSF